MEEKKELIYGLEDRPPLKDALFAVFLFLLFLAEIVGTFDLPGRGLLKRVSADTEVHDLLEGSQLLIDFGDTVAHSFFDIFDIAGFRILKVRVNLRGDRIIFLKNEDILNDRIVVKHIFNLFRSHIFSV